MTIPNTDTRAVELEADARTAFRFLSDPTNLPRWAIHFCQGVRRVGDGWIATTPAGEVGLEIQADPAHGVIDYHIRPDPDVNLVAESRVIPNGPGSVYVFTQHQYPGMTDEEFRGQVRSLEEEFEVLAGLMQGAEEAAR